MARMEQVSLMELGKLAAEGQVEAEVFAQIAQCAQKMTKGNKPYLDVSFADAEGTMGLKVWEDKPWFRTLASLPLRSFVSLRGQGAKEGSAWRFPTWTCGCWTNRKRKAFWPVPEP